MIRHPLLRWVPAILILGLVAGACTRTRDLDELRRELEEGETGERVDVDPPPRASEELTGRVGLIIATNSRTWGQLVNAANVEGNVVLFVQPDGPADGSGIRRGDVITEVDGDASPNAELGVVQLRSRPDDEQTLRLVKPDGSDSSVTLTARDPGTIDLRQLYAPLIEQSPNDPLLRFLMAQARPISEFDQAMEDVNIAIQQEAEFVEAISLRAELQYNSSRQDESLAADRREERQRSALRDWNRALQLDPRNTRVLVSRSQAVSQLGNPATGKTDAETALEVDPLFPGAHYALGVADTFLRRYSAAAEPARRAIELNPFDVRYYELMGLVFVRVGQRESCNQTMDAITHLLDEANTERLLRVCQRD